MYNRLANNVKGLKANSFLQLNEDKSEFIVFGQKGCGMDSNDNVIASWKKTLSFMKSIGFIFDSELKFDSQINAVVKNSCFYLRSIVKLKSILSFSDLEKAVNAFVSSRLDYFNALYIWV